MTQSFFRHNPFLWYLIFKWPFPIHSQLGRIIIIAHNKIGYCLYHNISPKFTQPPTNSDNSAHYISFSGKQREHSDWWRKMYDFPYSISKCQQGLGSVSDGALLWEYGNMGRGDPRPKDPPPHPTRSAPELPPSFYLLTKEKDDKWMKKKREKKVQVMWVWLQFLSPTLGAQLKTHVADI